MFAFDLAQLSQAVAADLAVGGPSDTSFAVARLVSDMPDAAFELAEHILRGADGPVLKGRAKKAKAGKGNGDRLTAQTFLLANALEELRYDVEAKKANALTQAARLRERLLHASQQPGTDPAALMLILQQFVVAKLEMGDALRSLMSRLIETEASAVAAAQSPLEDLGLQFAALTKDLDDDPFAIHTMIDEILQTLPEGMRAMIVLAALSQDAPALREAALGWLLNDFGAVRSVVISALEKGLESGAESGVTLRRMIALRNCLPEAERPQLDRAIKAGRKKVTCASWPRAKVLEAYASGFDGSGAQSIIMLAADGRKRSVVALLLKQGIGIRDAFVHHRLSKVEADMTLEGMAEQMPLSPTTLDYVAFATRHFLAVNAQSGVLPPFSLLDVAETVGLADVNPGHRGLEDFVASLCADIAPDHTTPEAIAKALKTSALWGHHQPMIDSWFDDSDEAATVLAPRKLPKAKRKAALLAMPLQKRRRWWAELIAWTAHTMRCGPTASGWEDLCARCARVIGSAVT